MNKLVQINMSIFMFCLEKKQSNNLFMMSFYNDAAIEKVSKSNFQNNNRAVVSFQAKHKNILVI